MLGRSLAPSPIFTPRLPQVKPINRARVTASTTTELHPLQVKSSQHTLYQVLRIKHNASQLEIKASYRSLAKQYHPDASAAASSDHSGADFILIHNAYATLSNPIARANYDVTIGARFAYSASNVSRFRRTRTWETDQCW
ncbi:Chaperone protein DnaJ [Euphorbia peplus]|nr:Chaperone protein DnaJ [Euphorbia peplus]